MTVQLLDIIRVTARFQMFEEDVQNVYHLRTSGTGSQTDAAFDASVVTWLESVYNVLNGQISDEFERLDIVIQNLSEGTPARFSQWTTYPTPTDTNTPLPLQVSALITFPSDTVKSIGRKFIGGFTEADNVDPGVPIAAVLADLATLAAAILTGFTSGTLTVKPGNWNADTAFFANWIFATVAGFWATQRRRRAGVGS